MAVFHVGPFELDLDVQDWDTVAVAVAVNVPLLGRYPIGNETLSPGRVSWSQPLNVTIKGTGVDASVALTIDVGRAIVQVDGKLDVKVLGKSIRGFPVKVSEPLSYPWPKLPVRPIGSGQIAHVVVAMMENRSFDNLVGWLYADTQNRPPRNIPPQSSPTYDALETHRYWCPKNKKYVNPPDDNPPDVAPPDDNVPEDQRAYAIERAGRSTVPDPDPLEQFRQMNYQLFGTETPAETPAPPAPATMKGFVVNYADAINEAKAKGKGAKGKGADPTAIMQTYAPDQVPVLTALARNFAICDRWFASVPCQTWPNRAFVHAGTSCGRVNNLDADQDSDWPPDPKYYNTKTVFNVLQDARVSWRVYADSPLPTLTRYQFLTQLGDPALNGHFRGFGDFKRDAESGQLPAYSFVEPDFMLTRNDYHPPHDVAAGERFLYEVWKAVSSGRAWTNTLLIITFDEHGGCYDHVPPPWTAVRPDDSKPQHPFGFDRYGVRVPAIVVSPWVEAGTVFRAGAVDGAEFDHTSILATLRDWQDLTKTKSGWLNSKRIAAAPTLARVLTRSTPRADIPPVPIPNAVSAADFTLTLNDVQRSILAASFMMAPISGAIGLAYKGLTYKTAAAQVAKLETVADAVRSLPKDMVADALRSLPQGKVADALRGLLEWDQHALMLRAAPPRAKKAPARKRKRSKAKR